MDASALIYNCKFLIFKDCQDDRHVGFVATHVSPGIAKGSEYVGVIHAVYLHGESNAMFDPMMAASTENENEYVESLSCVAREMIKALESHNILTGFAHVVDSDDGANSQETEVDDMLLGQKLATFHSDRQSRQVNCNQCFETNVDNM